MIVLILDLSVVCFCVYTIHPPCVNLYFIEKRGQLLDLTNMETLVGVTRLQPTYLTYSLKGVQSTPLGRQYSSSHTLQLKVTENTKTFFYLLSGWSEQERDNSSVSHLYLI